MIEKALCANCRYWLMPAQAGAVGECRRLPPTVFLLVQPPQPMGKLDIPGMHGKQAMTQAQMQFVSKWPPVPAEAGCGEHKFDEGMLESPAPE